MATVVNKYRDEFDVYIGRGSKWGNPYVITEDLSRDEAISLYRAHLWRQIAAKSITIDMLLYLKGKRLGCYCKPQPCHGDVIIDAISWAEQERELECVAAEYEFPVDFSE